VLYQLSYARPCCISPPFGAKILSRRIKFTPFIFKSCCFKLPYNITKSRYIYLHDHNYVKILTSKGDNNKIYTLLITL